MTGEEIFDRDIKANDEYAQLLLTLSSRIEHDELLQLLETAEKENKKIGIAESKEDFEMPDNEISIENIILV